MKKKPETLAEEIRQGDVSSFELFYKAEFDNIIYFINGYLHDLPRSKDIAQESLLALWGMREMIDPERNIRALAYTIARNKAINNLKSRSLFTGSSGKINEINANITALCDKSLEEELEALSLRELIERTMENLPETVRESFIMSRMLGMTNKEIARTKNMSLTGVEYHIKISLRIFREKLKDYIILWGWIMLILYKL